MKTILCLRGQEFSRDVHAFQVIFTKDSLLYICGSFRPVVANLLTIINHDHNQEYLHNQTKYSLNKANVKRQEKTEI